MPTLRFAVDSALLSELGERLVESVHVALLELVKNSYDADATEVTVALIPDEEGYRILVKDNGIGMTLEQVQSYWMRIATTNKAAERLSVKYGRTKAGSKGIGRFSCRRLGTQLDLKTTATLQNGRFETTRLTIDWDDYSAGTDVTEIACEGNTTRSAEGQTGTELTIIGGGDEEWSQRGWNVLKRRLILLVSNRGARRRGYKADPGFHASLIAPDFEESSVVDPREQLMNAGWGRLQLKVGNDGTAEWTLHAKRLGHRQLTLPTKYRQLSGTTADIAILPERKEQFRDSSAIAISSLRDALDEWGGVIIRVDGIRVPPYGEAQNDWLNIDRDRGLRKGASEYSPVRQLASKLQGVQEGRELLNLLSAKSYLGEVNVESPSGLFEMKASREGFVGDAGVDMLQELIRHGIDWSTVYRDYYIRLEDKDKATSARQEFEAVVDTAVPAEEVVENAIEYVQQEIRQAASHLPPTERRRVIQNVAKATEAVLKNDKLHREELRHLRLVASTSSLLLIFSHEVRSLLGVLDEYQLRLGLLRRGLDEKHVAQIDEMRDSFGFTKSRFNDLLGMTSLLTVDRRDAAVTELALAPRARKAAECFRLITTNYDITIDLEGIPNSLKVGPMMEAELYSILLNVFSNSIKSVIAAGKEKVIGVSAELAHSQILMRVSDTGLGVPKHSDDLFTPFVSDPDGKLYRNLKRRLNPEDENVVGTGSGLGLSIVKEIVESHSGTVCFASPEKGFNCTLEVVL
jgi:signal transduction histidine kinase